MQIQIHINMINYIIINCHQNFFNIFYSVIQKLQYLTEYKFKQFIINTIKIISSYLNMKSVV